MERFTKLISIDVEPNQASERMVDTLNQKMPRGKPMQLIREWMSAGYLLAELDHGIMQFLISLDSDTITREQRIQRLANYLQHWLDGGLENMPVAEAPVKPVTPAIVQAGAKPGKRRERRPDLSAGE